MGYSKQEVVSDGALVLLDISIDYFDREDITVYFDDVPNAYPWGWVGPTSQRTISFTPAVPAGVVVQVLRNTDISQPRHIFSLGAQFTAQSVDEDLKQVLQIAQEAKEGGWGESTSELRADLALPTGSNLVGYSKDGVVNTSIDAHLHSVDARIKDITDYGAVPGNDCAAAIIAAAAATEGELSVPAGSFVATGTLLNSAQLLAVLNRIRCVGTLSISLVSGTHNLTNQVVVNSATANRISINGASVLSTTATSQISVSGATKNYSVVIGVASSAGVSIGDYAHIRTDVTGTGDFYAHAGIWKVTAVDAGGSNRLTLLNTNLNATFPTNTLTGGSVKIIKTVLRFTGCDGMRFEGGQPLALLDQVALVGDWNLATSTGTTGAHGIVGVSPVITGGASSNTVFNTECQVILGVNVGLSAWGEQGIAISGRGSLVGNFVASCSNRKRGFYADGSSFRTKYAIANGNGEDGFIADSTGYIQCAYAIASGNGLNGFWSTNSSMIAGGNAKASGNLGSGFEARGSTRLAADDGVSINNGGSGFSAGDGGMIDADGATSSSNAIGGFDATSAGIIDCDNSVSTGNTGYGYRSQYGSVVRAGGCTVSTNTLGNYYSRDGSILLESSGTPNPNDIALSTVGFKSWNPQKTLYFEAVLTSTGDLALKSGATNRYVLRADGTMYAATDNTQALGRITERWSYVHAFNVRTHGVTVASLPAAGTAGAGTRAFVTDATASTFASTVAGGGAIRVPVYSDGTNWKIG